MSQDDTADKKFVPVQAHEVSDLSLLPGEFRAFRVEMRDILEQIARQLQTLARIEARLDVQQDTLNDHERRLAALEKPRRKSVRRK